jgi:hypothetical protein
MSDSPLYEAMREFIRAQVALEVSKATIEMRSVQPKVIEGPPGKDGRDGKDGINGKDGRDGVDGKDGAAGAAGERGEKGERGIDGLQGREGPSGKDGEKGERGDRGADGIATREELNSLVEERVAEIQVRTFADIYQGVYENGRLYTRGLLTTWGGSLWLSQAETKMKPGESPDWKLVVKKGADARK